MQLGQIEAFVESANHRSISRAAESLYVTQSALRGRLKQNSSRFPEHHRGDVFVLWMRPSPSLCSGPTNVRVTAFSLLVLL